MKLLAPHILNKYDGNLGAHPPAIKVASDAMDIAYVQSLIAKYPTIPIVLRFIDTQMDQVIPYGCAFTWFQRHSAELAQMRGPNVLIEFLNEPNQSRAVDVTRETLAWLNFMHDAGYRCLVLSTSQGTPMYEDEGPTHAIYQPILDALRPTDGAAPHEYLGDNLDTAVPHHILRFTKWPELMQHDIYIGECGSDADTPGGEAGWRNTFDGDLDAYLVQLDKLDKAYQAYPQVKAAFVYSIGQTQWGWDAYNFDWDRIVSQQEVDMASIRLGPLFMRHAGFVVTREFGYPDPYYADGWHKGTDFARAGSVGTEGAILLAPMDCTVDGVWYREDRGWYVYLKSNIGPWEYCAYHLMQEPYLKPGQVLSRGDVIGHVGKTGTTDAHLHAGICGVLDVPGWPIDIAQGRSGWYDIMSSDVLREWA